MTTDARLARLVETAVVEDRLRVVFQPCVRLSDGVPVGVEALLRMVDDEGAVVMPDAFIPVAEGSGAIVGMGAHVLAVACEQVSWWKDRLPVGVDFVAGVNLSPRQLKEPQLLEVLEAARGRLDPSAIVLELTEHLPPPSRPEELALLDALRAQGFHLALDDFGTGHASARTLRELPFDTVKLDRSWTARLCRTDAAGDLARSLAATAVRSGCTVVVEGIETPEDSRAAEALGCSLGQGFRWSRPVPAAAITAYLARYGGLIEDAPVAGPFWSGRAYQPEIDPGNDVDPRLSASRASGRA